MKEVIYKAGLTQTGTADPIVRVIRNDFPEEPVWTHGAGNNINFGTFSKPYLWKDYTDVCVPSPADDYDKCAGRIIDETLVRAIFDEGRGIEVIVTITMTIK